MTTYIRNLDPGKSTGLDGIGPRILQMSCDSISPSITALINKSIYETFWCMRNGSRRNGSRRNGSRRSGNKSTHLSQSSFLEPQIHFHECTMTRSMMRHISVPKTNSPRGTVDAFGLAPAVGPLQKSPVHTRTHMVAPCR